MKHLAIVLAVLFLSACTPEDARIATLEAGATEITGRVSVLETGTSAAATHTFTPTETRTATGTPTFTPTVVPTATPTFTTEPLATLTPTPFVDLKITANPMMQKPGNRVTFKITYNGGVAGIDIEFLYPPYTCCAIPDITRWTTTGDPFSEEFTFLLQSNATGAKMFQARAWSGNALLKTDTVIVDVSTGTASPTPTAATPTVTPTPIPVEHLEPRHWYYVENPARLPLVWLRNITLPVGAPGGKVWSYSEAFAPLDWEYATGWGWLILETGNSGVWLWMETAGTMDVAAVKFTARG